MNNLQKLNKSQLLQIINKMKKEDLIQIIENKIGGGDEKIIAETRNAIRKEIKFDESKLHKSNDNKYNSMKNNNKYINI
jgi:RIO-like serine/threonine protein kinase